MEEQRDGKGRKILTMNIEEARTRRAELDQMMAERIQTIRQGIVDLNRKDMGPLIDKDFPDGQPIMTIRVFGKLAPVEGEPNRTVTIVETKIHDEQVEAKPFYAAVDYLHSLIDELNWTALRWVQAEAWLSGETLPLSEEEKAAQKKGAN